MTLHNFEVVRLTVFYKNFLSLCAEAGKSPSAAVLEIGLKKSSVTRWKAGGMPSDVTLTKIATYFNVPVSELKDETDDPSIKKDLTENGEVDKETAELQEIWNSVDEDERQAILEVARLIRRKKG